MPVDGSETSGKAVRLALRVARETGAALRFVHAIGEQEGAQDLTSLPLARAILDEARAAAAAAGLEAETRVVEYRGHGLGKTVAEAARAAKADVIVIGSHGRRGVARAVLGSAAEDVMRHAPVPVLVVRGDGPP